jgi:hypothetical protein
VGETPEGEGPSASPLVGEGAGKVPCCAQCSWCVQWVMWIRCLRIVNVVEETVAVSAVLWRCTAASCFPPGLSQVEVSCVISSVGRNRKTVN